MPDAEPNVTQSKLIRASQFAYVRLLACYPRELRSRFGDEMAEVFAESLCKAAVQRGMPGIAARWGGALWELFTVAAPLRLESTRLRAGALSLLASAMLFLAFFSGLKKVL